MSWKQKFVDTIQKQKYNLSDSILCAVSIVYLGTMPKNYREDAISRVHAQFQDIGVLFNRKFLLQNILSDPIKVGKSINQFDLPNDQFSIENALIIQNTEQWSLSIDPQNQASLWIKKEQYNNQLKIIHSKLTANEILILTENCLQQGKRARRDARTHTHL